jgi:sialate O-acetylesterase
MKLRHLTLCFAFAASVLAASVASADVELPKIFGNGMVLQRDLATPVWGWAEAGEEVTVEFGDQKKTATATANGTWSVKLDAQKENSKGQSLKVSGKNSIAINDVLIGDVWICSGQSNMEWAVRNSLNPEEELKAANYPNIRLFNVPGHTTSPVAKDKLPGGSWQACKPDTVAGFSAVGYFFGRRLHKESKVPIGLIGTNWGGTRVEPWTPPVGFRQVPELKAIADQVGKFDKTTKVGGSTPTAIYQSMVHPLVPYGVRGAIWYQGESNGNEGESYFHKMQALIKGWRSVWGQGDFPLYFYFVQLADFQKPNDSAEGGNGWAKLREAQRKSLTIPHTGMAVITDIGNATDIHPRNKQDVGSRLAQWALRDVHKKDVVPSGPLFKELKIEDGKARVRFDHAADGLRVGKRKDGLKPTEFVEDGKLARFAVAGKDKTWHWATAQIDGDSVLVWSKEVPNPVAVRYAYSMNPTGSNLYNSLGLPASPFRTDSW